MRTTIVVVGNSPASFFIARQLEKVFASLVQYRVVWLTGDRYLVPLNRQHSLVGKWDKLDKKVAFSQLSLLITEVKQINLTTKRITTSRGTLEYDYLILDQYEQYTTTQLDAIKAQLAALLSSLAAAHNTGQPTEATVKWEGQSPESAQAGLLFIAECQRQLKHPGRARVYLESPVKSIRQFLTDQGALTSGRNSQAHLKIASPRPLILGERIKGARVGSNGTLHCSGSGLLSGFPEVLALSPSTSRPINLLHQFRAEATELVAQLERTLAGRSLPNLLPAQTGVFLRGVHDNLLLWSNLRSQRLRSTIIDRWERRLWRSLKS